MTASNLFTSEGLAGLAGFIARDTLFAFDLDGTLAPIVEEHADAKVADPVSFTLRRLAGLADVAIISGRSRKDARAILGFEPQLIVGNHGAEWPNGQNLRNRQFVLVCTVWRERLQVMLNDVPGVELEFKGESLSLHYRKADDRVKTIRLIQAAIDKLVPSPRIIGGKFVINLLPMEACTKGQALVSAMEHFGSKRAIYFGDDETDEEIFKISHADILGIHIGKDDRTAAQFYLVNQDDILGLLNSIVGIVEARIREADKEFPPPASVETNAE